MKTFHQFLDEDYKSLYQRDQELRQSIKDNLPEEDVFRRLSYNGIMMRLKKYYDVEKKEELIKGLLSNPTHLDKVFVTPVRGVAPKPSPKKKSSSVRKTQTISKTEK